MYDIVIVGAGPAGLSAAITARARGKEVLVISNKPEHNPLAKSSLVDNYPGIEAVTGSELLKKMLAHADTLGARFLYARVISVLPRGPQHFALTTSGDYIETKSVILTPGTTTTTVAYPGEQEHLGHGVSYCATCDGMLYRNATVCVVGSSPDAVEEANFLAGIGATVIYLAKTPPQGLYAGIKVYAGTVKAIKGDTQGVTAVIFAEKTRQTSGKPGLLTIPCKGVFILRHTIAPRALLGGLTFADGYIVVDAQMRTAVEGVFAAGDCVGKPLQIAKAVGDGQRAFFAAVEYLAN
ncbi:MAG: NAD(P)/FAD-dependent oxidoreductase [Coriobacteriales bacterium]|jgi:thioredoxin reductase (NADPH)|nr:NAD(P)/FAD-dependent oxidoreductase [Coriobacteriales bacterium]